MSRRRSLTSGLVIAMLLSFVTVLLTPAAPASAHGSVSSPVSRNYGCFLRWGSRFQDPAMATQDPMCYQAWQHDVNAMWNWNGLYKENVAGNHQAAAPDGQLCSAGRTGDGRYNSMDAVGNWQATNVGNSFNVTLFDQASHGADYVRVYVTRPGYNPLTTPLKWSDLQLVSEVGNRPASTWTPVTGGVQISLPVSLSGRTGRAMTYTIWKASHADQNYYFCSDINFGGTTTPPPSEPPPSNPPPSNPPPSNPPPAPAGACSASYAVTSTWQGGFQAAVTVTAGSAAIRGWNVTLTYPGAQTVQQSWNATVGAAGNTVTASNSSYNGTVGANGTASFGFIGASNTTPTVTCAATT